MIVGPTNEQVLLLAGGGAPTFSSTHSGSVRKGPPIDSVWLPLLGSGAFNGPSTAFTAEVWIKMSAVSNEFLFGQFDISGTDRVWFFKYEAAAKFRAVNYGADTTITELRWNVTPTVDTWYHFSVAYDMSLATTTDQIRLRINGADQGDGTVQSNGADSRQTASTSGTNFGIGNYDQTNAPATLKWDEFRLWTVQRSAAEVAADYNVTLSPPVSGLQTMWLADNDGWVDATSGGRDLGTTNNPTFDTDVPVP